MPAPLLPSPDLGLVWRSITLDDLERWQSLVQAIVMRDDPSERLDRDDLVEELTGGSFKDPARNSLIGVDGDGVAQAFGHMAFLPGTTLRRVFLWGGVHPDWRGRGIGRELLRWQTERAHQALAEQHAAGVPWRIVVDHQQKLIDRSALCKAAGYTSIRWFNEMLRPLGDGAASIPEVSMPAGLVMASWTDDLDESVRCAHNDAFARHWGSQPRDDETWKTWTTGHRSFRRDWCRVVLDPTQPDPDGRPAVAAYLSSHAYPQDWEAKGYTQGWVDLIGVRPAWRGRGLAPALLAECLHAYAASGMDAAGLDVDTGNATGALDLYLRMGFRVEHTSVAWALESPGASGL
jgi:mycothiol synthase